MVHYQGRPRGVGGYDNLKGYFIQTPEHWNAWPLEENAKLAYAHEDPIETDAALLDRAVAYAQQKYAGLYRDSTDRVPAALPYIVHPMDVMQRVANLGIEDTDMLVASLLHDLLEDTKTPASELGNKFGPKVQNFVECLTYNKSDGSKSEYMRNIAMFEIPALIIKLADRASNVESFRHGNPDYAGTYARKATAIYDAVLGRREEILLHFGEHVCANATNLANELLNF